ncbi:MAG: hypothetical protein H6622_18360 [Halobacteriovoraceae bacterium]|nr:hypothetical protein [Halobacteriovoraceae bacterium]
MQFILKFTLLHFLTISLFAATNNDDCDGSCAPKLSGVNEDVVIQATKQESEVDKILTKIESLKETAKRNSEKNSYLKKCLTKYAGKNPQKKQRYIYTLSCGESYEREGSADYELEAKEGLMILKLRGTYSLDWKSEDALPEFLKTLKCVQNKFSEYGIYFEPEFLNRREFLEKEMKKKPSEQRNRFAITLSSRPGDIHQHRWHTKTIVGRKIPADELCGLTTHELLHYMGLPDLYESGNCGSRGPFFHGDKSNIMLSARRPIGKTSLSEDQITHIVRPICEPKEYPDEGYMGSNEFIFTPETHEYTKGGTVTRKIK